MYITRLASKEIFSPSNKIYREVGWAKDLSAPRYVALGIQREIRMRRIITSSVVCPALQNFSIFSHKPRDFRKKKSY